MPPIDRLIILSCTSICVTSGPALEWPGCPPGVQAGSALTSRVTPRYVAARMATTHGAARLDLLDPFEVSRLGGLEVVTEGLVEGFLAGLHRSPRRGFSVEFAEHRMYQPGDELRYVDWKLLGRKDRLYVKQFEEETNLRAMVVLDASRSMAWSGLPDARLTKFDYARRLDGGPRAGAPPPAGRDRARGVRRHRPRHAPAAREPRPLDAHRRHARPCHAGPHDRGRPGAAGRGRTAAAPRPRRVRFRPPARPGSGPACAQVPPAPRPLGAGAARARSGGARARRSGRSAVRGSRDRAPRWCSGRGTGPRCTARPCETWWPGGALALRREGIRYHAVRTDLPFGRALREALVRPGGIA